MIDLFPEIGIVLTHFHIGSISDKSVQFSLAKEARKRMVDMRFGCVRFIFMRITLRSVESDLPETLEGQHGMCVVLIQSTITEWGRFDIYIYRSTRK